MTITDAPVVSVADRLRGVADWLDANPELPLRHTTFGLAEFGICVSTPAQFAEVVAALPGDVAYEAKGKLYHATSSAIPVYVFGNVDILCEKAEVGHAAGFRLRPEGGRLMAVVTHSHTSPPGVSLGGEATPLPSPPQSPDPVCLSAVDQTTVGSVPDGGVRKVRTLNHGCFQIVKGVSWHRAGQKWQASIRNDGRSRGLGLFTSAEEAARAYDAAAVLAFGEFAYVNFPGGRAA